MSCFNTIGFKTIHSIPPNGYSCTTIFSSSYSFSQNYFSITPPKPYQKLHIYSKTRTLVVASAISSGLVKENLPPALDASSGPPAIFDGIPKLYISYSCPYAQRVWITRNVKGLQDKIKLVPIDLKNRPAWYKEKVYPANKVPALEYNNEVKGESLDLMKYIDTTFEGPSLFPDDLNRRSYGEELLAYVDTFYKLVITAIKEDQTSEANAAFDYIEDALAKYDDGPFLLGDLSLVDIAYAPFVERFQPFLQEVKNYEITKGRPKLKEWIEAMNKIEAYKETKQDPKQLVESYKKRFLSQI